MRVAGNALDPCWVESYLFAHLFSAAPTCSPPLIWTAGRNMTVLICPASLLSVTAADTMPSRLDPVSILAFICSGGAVGYRARKAHDLVMPVRLIAGLADGLVSPLIVRTFFSLRPSCRGTAKCIRHSGRDVSSRMGHFIVKPQGSVGPALAGCEG